MSIEHDQPQFSDITYTTEYVNHLEHYIRTSRGIYYYIFYCFFSLTTVFLLKLKLINKLICIFSS